MESSHGIITRMTKFSETSLIVHWCTRDHGIIKTAAKGARSPKSAFAGQLDLFVSGDVIWVPSRSSDLHSLREIQAGNRRRPLSRSYKCTLMASYFCQLIEQVVEPDSPVPELHDLLTRALDYLCEAEPDSRTLLHFEKRLAEEIGLLGGAVAPIRAIENHFGHRAPKHRADLLDS